MGEPLERYPRIYWLRHQESLPYVFQDEDIHPNAPRPNPDPAPNRDRTRCGGLKR